MPNFDSNGGSWVKTKNPHLVSKEAAEAIARKDQYENLKKEFESKTELVFPEVKEKDVIVEDTKEEKKEVKKEEPKQSV